MEPEKQAERATAQLMAEICERRGGMLYVSEHHLATAVKTRKYQLLIGAGARADKIRGWLAAEVNSGRAMLLDPLGLEWMGQDERTLATLRLKLVWEQDQAKTASLRAQLEREEAKGALKTWAIENEEPPREGEMITLRKEKRAQLRTARHRTWKKLGQGALNATILLLLLQGVAYPEVDPNDLWIENAAAWIHTRNWCEDTEQEMTLQARARITKARSLAKQRDGSRN
jgi:hypothetical protein